MLPVLFKRGDLGRFWDSEVDNALGFWNEYKKGFYPKVDIHEDDKNIYVEADLAGLEQKDIKVEIDDENVLKLSGEREYKQESKENNYHRVERQRGSFERSFVLGQNVDVEKVQAEFKNGELKLTLPKKAENKPRQIEIK